MLAMINLALLIVNFLWVRRGSGKLEADSDGRKSGFDSWAQPPL
jgi:hypothetical protein